MRNLLNIFQYVSSAFRNRETLQIRKIEDVFPEFSASTITIFHPILTPTGVRLIELILFAYLASSLEDVAFFEIGTSEGRTARNIVLNLRPKGCLATIDLPLEQSETLVREMPDFQQEEIRFANSTFLKTLSNELLNKVVLLSGDSTRFDFSEHFGKYDVVFVDGNHAYDAILKDAQTAKHLLRPEGGIVLFHDYLPGSMPSVAKAIHDLSKTNKMIHLAGTKLALWIIKSPRTSVNPKFLSSITE